MSERGFDFLLSIVQFSPCPIYFQSTSYELCDPSGKKSLVKIIDGKIEKIEKKTDNAEEENEEIDSDRTISFIGDGVISCNSDDPAYEDIQNISRYFYDTIKHLYDVCIKTYNLKFNIEKETNKIFLEHDSSVTTTTNGYANVLFRDIPEGEQKFADFIQSVVSPDGIKPCKNPVHSIKKLDVIYYRAHKTFPSVNENRLYQIVKRRITACNPQLLEEKVGLCLKCSLEVSGARHEQRGSKLTNKQPSEVPPHVFEALTPAEMFTRRSQSVGLAPGMHRGFCYSVNIRESPYRSTKCRDIRKAPDRVHYIPQSGECTDEWALRLSGPPPTLQPEQQPYDAPKPPSDPIPVPEPKEIKNGYFRADRRVYTGKPFSYAFIDKVNRRANKAIIRASKQRK